MRNNVDIGLDFYIVVVSVNIIRAAVKGGNELQQKSLFSFILTHHHITSTHHHHLVGSSSATTWQCHNSHTTTDIEQNKLLTITLLHCQYQP